MSDQPDKLFREKLYGYQRSVPSHLWPQVSANLNNKRRLVWWHSAAAIALLCVAGIVIYPLTRTNPPEIAKRAVHSAGTDAPPISQLAEPETDVDDEASKASIASRTSPDETTSPKEQTSIKNSPSSAPASTNTDDVSQEIPVISAPEPQPVTHIAEAPQTSGNENPGQVAHADRQRTTIVFTQAEVNAKYLSKSHRPDATSGDQETSRLKNMLDKAYDLTHNQDPIGDLRQKKNEILAMNFRKGKTDTQND